AMLRKGDHIHVTLDDDHASGVANRTSCEIKAVKLISLREDGSFRGVEVFWLAGFEHTAAKADNPAAPIVDWKHNAIAKAIVSLAIFAGDHEPGRFERWIVVRRERRAEILPTGGRVADAEMRGHGAGEAATFQVLDGGGGLLQLSAIELRRDEQRLAKIMACFALLALARPVVARHFEPRVAGERFDRFRERLARVFHQESDRRAVRAAAEAVIELLRR